MLRALTLSVCLTMLVIPVLPARSVTPPIPDAIRCNVANVKTVPGLTAVSTSDALSVQWDGEPGQEVRLQFSIQSGTPTIRELAVRKNPGAWATLGTNLKPEYNVVSGIRRISAQQLQPLRELGVEITPQIVDKYKWDAFWDAPLTMAKPGRVGGAGGRGAAPSAQDAADSAAPRAGGRGAAGGGRGAAAPYPAHTMVDQVRTPAEVRRADAAFHVTSCDVATDGTHLTVSFPGVSLGTFNGSLQYTVYRGSNLIRQEIVAKTTDTSVAYKYDAGLGGFSIGAGSRMVWRDISNLWQDYQFGGAVNDGQVALQTANRTIVAEGRGGSVAAFPPPHSFFWSREISINLGYNWYRKDSATSYAFGIRQPEHEDAAEDAGNFALYSARPGTEQRMPLYLYVSPATGQSTLQSALAFTRQDHYKALPGYQIMATHFHTGPLSRPAELGGLNHKLADFQLAKATGINIMGPIGAGGGGRGGGDRLASLANYYELARRNSDKTFLVMPNEEGAAGGIGGHNDVLISKPVYWDYERPAGTPFTEQHPKYGKVYHVGSAADMMELARLENMLVYMPHPRSKGSTGYPDAIKDTPAFLHDNYRGIGMRWGMGLDGSERRLCEIRCQTLLDDMNNWIADRPIPLKFVQAITETYENHAGDDFYANSPVNYVKTSAAFGPNDWSPVIDAMKRGDYFWSSGEVLIPSYAVRGTGTRRTIVADVEWTFPLAFVEVVWGDGTKTERQIISTTDLPAMGRKHFEIPFDATGKKWVRFAAWDTATNGAMVQPIRLTTPAGR